MSNLTRPQRKAPEPAEVEGTERLLADVSASIYRRVKIRCVERGISLKAYLLGLVLADLKKADDGTTVRPSARTPVRIVPTK